MSQSEFTGWGTDLPPVGIECTVDFSSCVIVSELGYALRAQLDGKNAVVVAHDVVFGLKVAVFRVIVVDRMYGYHSLSAECFSPAKTKRERDIEALVDHLEAHYSGVQDQSPDIVAHRRTVSLRSAEIAYDFIVSRIGGES